MRPKPLARKAVNVHGGTESAFKIGGALLGTVAALAAPYLAGPIMTAVAPGLMSVAPVVAPTIAGAIGGATTGGALGETIGKLVG